MAWWSGSEPVGASIGSWHGEGGSRRNGRREGGREGGGDNDGASVGRSGVAGTAVRGQDDVGFGGW